jgi:uncharacterized protein YyaL (SSP411 family)
MHNHLKEETSPYLLQHAENPVEWHSWNEATLAKARAGNKPILLSVGYAACHWCHVMAHESFEDESTAQYMNKFFINIKVDREERPDIDKIYQTTHFLLTERGGGWPLTVFLTPEDFVPFFSGTYFPPKARAPLPAFKDVLIKIAEIYRDRQDDIRQQNQGLLQALRQTHKAPEAVVELTSAPLQIAQTVLENTYDAKNGGFGPAPKFPNSCKLDFLQSEQSAMALNTLLHMAAGGIYDQLRGGFYRYSVDAQWQIPHFEKMLYDNAQLLLVYAKAAKIYDEPYFEQIARETAQWVLAEMQAPNGGYYASLDADSAGHEGLFYIWDISEIEDILTSEEFALVKVFYGLEGAPNFEGRWHLRVVEALYDLHEKQVLANARKKLLSARDQRPRPYRDEKILTSWNGLMIKAMLVAGDMLQEPAFIASAQEALTFVRENLWHQQRLYANYKDGKATLNAYLDDYVFMLDAVLTSLAQDENDENSKFARDLADVLLQHFFDSNAGGFFFTADDHEKLLYRPKTFMDEALPSANGVAVRLLTAMGKRFGDDRYTQAGEQTLRGSWNLLTQYPAEHCSLLIGLAEFLS